jgi:GDPmannose 4,6-dehydratase
METHSVRDMTKYVFESLNLNYEDYVIQNEIFIRPEELKYLKGDSTKARTTLDWKPEYTFESMPQMKWLNIGITTLKNNNEKKTK